MAPRPLPRVSGSTIWFVGWTETTPAPAPSDRPFRTRGYPQRPCMMVSQQACRTDEK
jgi:hypothetical protein